MQTCRKALPSARLQLCTNGLLLKKMDDRFWQSLHDNDVQLIISSYPVKIDYEWIMKKAAETGVEKVLRAIKADCTFVCMSSDELFPPEDMRPWAEMVPGAKYIQIDTLYGHDGFLVETEAIGRILAPALP